MDVAHDQLDLVDAARWVGRFRFVEIALFATLGARSATATPHELGVFLSVASAAHGYRGSLFEPLLPVSDGLPDPAALTISPSGVVDEVIAELGELDGADLLAVLIDVVYEESRRGLSDHLERLVMAQDAPVILAIRRALLDLQLTVEHGTTVASMIGGGDQSVVEHFAGAVEFAGGLYGQKMGLPAGL